MQATLSATPTTAAMSSGAQTARTATITRITTTWAEHCLSSRISTAIATKATTESHKMQIVSNAEVICRSKRKRTGNASECNMFAIGELPAAASYTNGNTTRNNMHVNDVGGLTQNSNNNKYNNIKQQQKSNQNNDMNPVASSHIRHLQQEVASSQTAKQRSFSHAPPPSAAMPTMASCLVTCPGITKITSFPRMLSIALMMFFLASCAEHTQAALSHVNLFISPPAVRRGQTATLFCQYTLEGAPLYSVKFYRGQLEFFRVTPGEFPTTKVLPYASINVDERSSNASQVVIRNADFALTGNFSCEVTADAPLYSSATGYAQLQVVEFPDKRPQLFTERTRYEPGDVLRANCSTPPSRPRAVLRFTINNVPVSSEAPQYIRARDNLIATRLSLKLQLQSVHFAAANTNSHLINALGVHGDPHGVVGSALTYNTINANNIGGSGVATGGLLLRCTAQIGDLYQDYKEIELGTPQRDPIPARVTLSAGSGLKQFFETYFFSTSAAGIPTPRTKLICLLVSLSVLTLRLASSR